MIRLAEALLLRQIFGSREYAVGERVRRSAPVAEMPDRVSARRARRPTWTVAGLKAKSNSDAVCIKARLLPFSIKPAFYPGRL